MFGKAGKDFAGLVSEHEFKEQGLAASVLCEGCGFIYVDNTGHRVKSNSNKEWERY
nr:MAG TPA: hypothetical protein [Caudoviricetes sp.]